MSASITNTEAAIIFNAALNMRDDFLDYYGSMHGLEAAKKMEIVFNNGMEKLRVAGNKANLDKKFPYVEQKHTKLPHHSTAEYPESIANYSEY